MRKGVCDFLARSTCFCEVSEREKGGIEYASEKKVVDNKQIKQIGEIHSFAWNAFSFSYRAQRPAHADRARDRAMLHSIALAFSSGWYGMQQWS